MATTEQRSTTTRFSSDDLARRAFERRAIEAVNWGMPAVNLELMLEATRRAGGDLGDIVYWSRLPDWKIQTLTPNCDVIYVTPFFSTKDGPMVLEIPPADAGSITGTIMDGWQAALEDVGPHGFDQGKGGRYLILPPDHRGSTPPGFNVLHSDTYRGYALLRSIVASDTDADVAKAVAYARRIQLYPLAQAGRPPATRFLDAFGTLYDSAIPYDVRFFQALDRVVQTEPWLARDKVMIDILKSIGIEKGQPFRPDAKTSASLNVAASEARAWLDARYERGFPSFFGGSQWTLPIAPELKQTAGTFYESSDVYCMDARGLTDYFAYSTIKSLGAGQFYLMSTKDADGQALDGASRYRLVVPAHVPATQYWSTTVYDRTTHLLLRGVPRASRASRAHDLRTNSDGSVHIFFGPTPPAGNESNWIPTLAGNKFEVMFRIYGPEKAFFEKQWKLPDLTKE